MNVIAVLLFVVIGLARTSAAPQIQAADEHADIYSIYSLMMTNPSTSHGPSTDEVYLIADMTRPAFPFPDERCVRVPPQYGMAYREAFDEYQRRKDKPVKLERAFNIPKPYELLNAEEVRQFEEIRAHRPIIPNLNPKGILGKITDLYWLADVYFNQQHTLALTGIFTFCGDTCGITKWRIFEKSSTGQWEERPWGCGAIAHNEETTPSRWNRGVPA
jgi:hypothetical protein